MIDNPESPYLKANPISKIFFCWLNGLFAIGNKRELLQSDLFKVLPEDESKRLGDKLAAQWTKQLTRINNINSKSSKYKLGSNEKLDGKKVQNDGKNLNGKKPSLIRTLFGVFGVKFCALGLFALVEECVFKLFQPIFLGYLLRYFAGTHGYTERDGYLFAGGLSLSAGLYTFTHHPFFFGVMHCGMRTRVAVCSLIYRKALRLSNASLGRTNVGQMINLLSNDVNRFDSSFLYLHYLWVGPIMTLCSATILWTHFGPACLTGLSILLLSIPFQGYMGKMFSKYRVQTASRTDTRIRIMNEIISGMQVIKMYTWEKPFAALVHQSRENEIKLIKKTARLRAVNFSIFFTSSKVIFFITLLTYIYTGNSLTAEKVFVSLALYNNVKLVMTLFFPFAVAQAAETLVSIKRLEDFLTMEERDMCSLEDQNEDLNEKSDQDKLNLVEMKNLFVKWTPDGEDSLSNISLKVKPGELIACIGHVGSGKSSLLQAILRELPTTSGFLKIKGRLAYTAQESWIYAGSVRENILFGREYQRSWYKQVVSACALDKDLKLFAFGDKTLVGDRGTALSGGQKARINLARAVYANADIYLLDDPLSAVDAEVGRHLFENCINGILKEKARILVTHQLQFLKFVDHIILLENGHVQVQGNYEELLQTGINFAQLLKNDEKKVDESDDLDEIDVINANIPKKSLINRRIHRVSESESLRKESVDFTGGDPQAVEEQSGTGDIKFSLFKKYLTIGSNWFNLTLLVVANIGVQVLYTGGDWWLNLWTKEEEARALRKSGDENAPQPDREPGDFLYKIYHDRDTQVYIYTALTISVFIISMIRSLNFFHIALSSSIALHKEMFEGVIRAPMRFFEQNPIGRVLNRFSKDTGNIDDMLPTTLYDTIEIFINMTGVIVIVSIVNPILLIPTFILAILFYFLRRFYIKTGRAIKRIEGISKSPVFSHLSTSLYGLTTIRAFKAEDIFVQKFDDFQDSHSSAWFLFLATTRWLGIRLDWISVIFLGIVTFSFMFFSPDGGTEVGLAISSAMILTGMFQWGVRQSAELENHFVSVERVLDYTKIESEASLESQIDKKPPNNWPEHGQIVMKNVQLRYSEDSPPVLNNVNCTIRPCEKVGIVGRTGAGKSSLLTTLFRITEPSGIIEIDGINVLQIGLHDLRSKISIIPQDPVMFTGSLRRNLDPFSNFNDSELWKVLQEVHLAEDIKAVPAGIDVEVSEGGSNFSVGQRQLICLGRAVLRQNKILVLDEATASVDPETDALIQKTIRTKFSNCTVLTIAHRLHTVMDSDRILVLDAGQVKEFDEPYILLQDPSSGLSQLVDQTGKSTADHLFEIAKEAALKRTISS